MADEFCNDERGHQFCDADGERVYLYCQRGCGTRDPLEPPSVSAPDDRPSTAQLQRDVARITAGESGWTYSRDRLIEAAPVLLEIAAAALAWAYEPVATAAHGDAYRRFADALSKVRP